MPDPRRVPPQDNKTHDDAADYYTCDVCGGDTPIRAGVCIHCPMPRPQRTASPPVTVGGGAVPPIVQAFIDSNYLQERFEGIRAVSDYGLRQYDNAKLGMVNHITAGGGSIDVLTNWFRTGGTGASHFGIGRESAGLFVFGAVSVPVAPVHQYVPTTGRLAPWCQGVREWKDNPNCDIKVPAVLRALPPLAANPAFLSVENVALKGSDLVTDAQFNSNVFIRAWGAAYFQYPITPETQLWHSEFDGFTRCFDPGWPGELEDEMQQAAIALLKGDTSKLRKVSGATPITPVETDAARIRLMEIELQALRAIVGGKDANGIDLLKSIQNTQNVLSQMADKIRAIEKNAGVGYVGKVDIRGGVIVPSEEA